MSLLYRTALARGKFLGLDSTPPRMYCLPLQLNAKKKHSHVHSERYTPPLPLTQGNVQLRLTDYDAAYSAFSRAADLAPGIAGYRLRAGQLQFQVRWA